MKFNKWTLGLAAVGVVSLASAARADEKVTYLQTALTGTTISGFVDTSAQWNLGTGNANNPPYSFGGDTKADGFNLNVLQLTIDKPLDESQWAAGYHADLWFGPDAATLGTLSTGSIAASGENEPGDFAIRQAYVTMRTPVGNGIDWKIGVFDTVIGYESLDSTSNPNYTRSYGFTIEPTTHTGLVGTYRINDIVSLTAGIADSVGPTINGRAFNTSGSFLSRPKAESYKTYMAAIALTAPKDWGWAAGSTLYAGVVNGYSSSYGDAITSYYVGGTLATPVTGLKVGLAFDYLDIHNKSVVVPGSEGNVWNLALYTSFQVNEKLSLNGRAEYLEDRAYFFSGKPDVKVCEVSVDAQYDLWKNVISRVELRWDHGDNGRYFGSGTSSSTPTRKNAVMLAANIIYKF